MNFRLKLINDGMVNFHWPITPIHGLLWITDVNLIQFLLNLNPNVHKKAGGFTKEVFGGDPHGLLGGLVMNDGAQWHLNRKRIGKLLHTGTLENSFIEEMDIAANILVEQLAGLSKNQQYTDDTEVKNKVIRYAFDIMLKALMGDINNDIQIRIRFDTFNDFRTETLFYTSIFPANLPM